MATVFGNSPLVQTPSSYTIICLPSNYKQDPLSQNIIKGFTSDPTLIQLRGMTQVQTYSANDPDFRQRFAGKMPQVVQGKAAVLVVQDNQVLYGKAGVPSEQLAVDIRNCGILLRLRGPCIGPLCPYPNNPNCPNYPQPNQPYQPNTPDPVLNPTTAPDRPLIPDVTVQQPTVSYPPVTQPIIQQPVPTVTQPVIQQPIITSVPVIQQPVTISQPVQTVTQTIEVPVPVQVAIPVPQQVVGSEPDKSKDEPKKSELKDIQAQIEAVHNQITHITQNTPQIDLKPVIDAINANKLDMTQLLQVLMEIKNQNQNHVITLPPVTSDIPIPTVAVGEAKVSDQPIIVVTASFLCDGCDSVVSKAKEAKQKSGRNIKFIKLDGALKGLDNADKKIKLDGVPVIYDFQANRSIVGTADCLSFLNSL